MILVTGATGTNGRELVDELNKRRIPFRAMVRDANKRNVLPQGVQLVEGDFAKPDSLARRWMVSITHSSFHHLRRGARNLRRTLLLRRSMRGCRTLSNCRSSGPICTLPAGFKGFIARSKSSLRNSGMGWTNLRPNLFMQTSTHVPADDRFQKRYFYVGR